MITNQNAAVQTAGAGTLRANFLRTLLKRAVMWAYCRDLISDKCVADMFARFHLRSA